MCAIQPICGIEEMVVYIVDLSLIFKNGGDYKMIIK